MFTQGIVNLIIGIIKGFGIVERESCLIRITESPIHIGEQQKVLDIVALQLHSHLDVIKSIHIIVLFIKQFSPAGVKLTVGCIIGEYNIQSVKIIANIDIPIVLATCLVCVAFTRNQQGKCQNEERG